MIFRSKCGEIIFISRLSFNSDKEYYSYIKKNVIMYDNVKNHSGLVDRLVSSVKLGSSGDKKSSDVS